jgi:hypothetical protein
MSSSGGCGVQVGIGSEPHILAHRPLLGGNMKYSLQPAMDILHPLQKLGKNSASLKKCTFFSHTIFCTGARMRSNNPRPAGVLRPLSLAVGFREAHNPAGVPASHLCSLEATRYMRPPRAINFRPQLPFEQVSPEAFDRALSRAYRDAQNHQ